MSEQSGFGPRPPGPSTIPEKDGVSLFELLRITITSRGRIFRWAIIGGAIAVGPVLLKPLEYTANASFSPQGPNSPGGLVSLAGQFGLGLARSESVNSPDFYADLLRSRTILGPIVDGASRVGAFGDSLVPMLELLEISESVAGIARVKGIEALSRVLTIDVSPATGVLRLGITSRWPEVSLDIAEKLVAAVSRFNLEARQSRAAAERRFLQTRLQEANDSVAITEARLGEFLRTNRQFNSSPDLTFEHERFQRRVSYHQGILTALANSFEDARVREVRDTPVITILDAPELPARPDPRGRTRRGLLGMLFGGIVGALLGFWKEALGRRTAEGDSEWESLQVALRQVKQDFIRWIPGRRAAS